MKDQKVITQEEAIKRLKESRFTIQPYNYMNQALDMAISTLEKQISMKPVFVHPLQFDDCGDYMCSSCQKGSVLDTYGNKPDYCHYCGQKLDWSDL